MLAGFGIVVSKLHLGEMMEGSMFQWSGYRRAIRWLGTIISSPYLHVCLVFIVGFCIGAGYVLSGHKLNFNQIQLPSAVMEACGFGFRHPDTETFRHVLLPFLDGVKSEFDCDSIPKNVGLSRLSLVEDGAFYRLISVGYMWKLMGVSYSGLWPLIGLMHGFYAVMSYVLFSLFFQKYLSLVGSILVTTSSYAIGVLALWRDYSKAPFMIVGIIFTVQILRCRTVRAALIYSAMSGIVLAIGIGFRPDVMLVAPFVILAIIIRCEPLNLYGILRGAGLNAVFLIALLGVASPVFSSDTSHFTLKDGQGIWGMQGLTVPYTRFLELQDSYYDLGHVYSDEFTNSWIVGYGSQTDKGPLLYNVLSGAEKVGGGYSAARYFVEEMKSFPADVIIRSVASVMHVLNFYDFLTPDQAARNPRYSRAPSDYAFSIWSYQYLATPIRVLRLQAFGWILFPLCSLWMLTKRKASEVYVLTGMFLFLAAVAAFQFAWDHFFYLEFLSWMALFGAISVASWMVRHRALPPRWRLWMFSWLVLAGVVGLSLGGARWIQSREVRERVAKTLGARQVDVEGRWIALSDGRVLFQVPIPSREVEVTTRANDGLTTNGLLDDDFSEAVVEAGLETYIVGIGGAKCRSQSITVTAIYEQRPGAWQNLERTFRVTTPAEPDRLVHIVLPALYRASQNFAGLTGTTSLRACLVRIARIEDPHFRERPYFAVLQPDWQERTAYQTFDLSNR